MTTNTTTPAALGYLPDPCACGAPIPRRPGRPAKSCGAPECRRALAADRSRRARARAAGQAHDSTGAPAGPVSASWPMGYRPWILPPSQAAEVLQYGDDGRVTAAVPDDSWTYGATAPGADTARRHVVAVAPLASADFGPDTEDGATSPDVLEWAAEQAHRSRARWAGARSWPVCQGCDWPHPADGPHVLAEEALTVAA